ncbi:M56 family metallopeptidase [Zobellia amurskyensis]|uniref:M56 family metallopeptidase n=1 Tax=Zobellia amurskyensis TaxID=248905 RepID=A0A7X3D0E1_9FLAO|nr:M56 family metallopeptidase [Zobellia amurskyensis]MUH34368.1 M56 family metallopeptidase [Zobellia amurskyensis]
MVLFLLKSTACLALFMAFYKLALENERMHGFKRLYLIMALLLSVIIPSITFVDYVEAASLANHPNDFEAPLTNLVAPSAIEESVTLNTTTFLLSIYFIGVVLFSYRFSKNLGRIFINIRNNPKLRMQSFINVLLQDVTVPHTFFNYIFLNKKEFEAREIPEEVLLHEATHAKQKHSLDILFIEVLQIIFWFNPLIYIIKSWIKLNHEFLADQAVLNQGTATPKYQNILLAFASSTNLEDNQSSLANAINYSSIKKRFTVMKKRTSKQSVVLRSVAVLPLITMLLFGFSEQITLPKEPSAIQTFQNEATEVDVDHFNLLAKKYNTIPKEQRHISLEDLKILEHIYGKMSLQQRNNAQPFPECADSKTHKTGACTEEITEYNALAKKYNKMLAKGKNIRILKTEVDRMAYLYAQMNAKQRVSAQRFPALPEPPTAPTPPEEAINVEKFVEYAVEIQENAIEEIVAHQELYDEVHVVEYIDNPHKEDTFVRKNFIVHPSSPSEPPAPHQSKTSIKINNIQKTVPPPFPPYKIPEPREQYSKELLTAFDAFSKEAEANVQAIAHYNKTKEGKASDLWISYKKAMLAYNEYVSLAVEEGLLARSTEKK